MLSTWRLGSLRSPATEGGERGSDIHHRGPGPPQQAALPHRRDRVYTAYPLDCSSTRCPFPPAPPLSKIFRFASTRFVPF